MSRELPSTWKAQPSIIRKAAWVISVVPRSTEHAKVLNQRSYPLFKKAHKSEKLWYQGEIKSWQTVLANCMMVFANSPANHSSERASPFTGRVVSHWWSVFVRSTNSQKWFLVMMKNFAPVGFVPSLNEHNKIWFSVIVCWKEKNNHTRRRISCPHVIWRNYNQMCSV